MSVLAASERYFQKRKRAYKMLTDWIPQVLLQVRRWLLGRRLVVVMDASFAAINFLWQVAKMAHLITLISCFRLAAALRAPAVGRRTGNKEGHAR